MRVRYLIPCAALFAATSATHAYWMGNLLIPRDQASDIQPYVYNVYYNAPMPSAGTVDGIAIYQMDYSNLPEFCDSFTVRLLHYTGVDNIYLQYYTSKVFGIYGPANAVQTYWFDAPVEVQAGDLFVTYGGGITFSDNPTTTDAYYFSGSDFAPADVGLVTLGNQPYIGNRTYSAEIDFNPAAGAAGTPEPATLLSLSGGCVALLARRKRKAQ